MTPSAIRRRAPAMRTLAPATSTLVSAALAVISFLLGKTGRLPRCVSALHLHHGDTVRGELHGRGGGELAGLAVAIENRGAILRNAGEGVPLALRQIDRARDVSGLVIAGQAHIDERHLFAAADHAVELERPRDEGQFLREELLRGLNVLLTHVATPKVLLRAPCGVGVKYGRKRPGVIGRAELHL